MAGFARELAQNNSVSFIPYRRENRRYGRVAMGAVEKHFVDSSRIVLSMLTAGVTPEQRVTAVVAMYLIVLLRLGAGALPRGDHADLFARQRDVLLPLGRRMRALVERTDRLPPGDGLAGWAQTMAGLQKELEPRRQPAVTADRRARTPPPAGGRSAHRAVRRRPGRADRAGPWRGRDIEMTSQIEERVRISAGCLWWTHT